MTIPEFNEKELEIIDYTLNPFNPAEKYPVFDYPVKGKEAGRMLYEKKPVWQMVESFDDMFLMFNPHIIPDNIARAFVFDCTFVPGVSNLGAGLDMFGIEWEYEESAGGSMVRPGNPLVDDAEELADKVVWPDVDSWDWAGASEANKEYLSGDKFVSSWFFTGWFERLISMMDFEGAVMSLIDEDQQEAVTEFLTKLTDLYIKIIGNMIEYFPQIDCFLIHDDWGAQKDAFFSPATAEEMIVPHMKRVTDFIRSKGKYSHLHSCGMLMKQCENIAAAGWDAWVPQAMNDTLEIYNRVGDKMLIGVIPEDLDPETATEEELKAAVKKYVDSCCKADKPSFISYYTLLSRKCLNDDYRKELYKQSRIAYAK